MMRKNKIFKSITLSLVILMSFTTIFACANNPENPIVDSGKIVERGATDYSIVTPNTPSECNSYAAEELQLFIKECTGVNLPIKKEQEITYTAQSKIISVGSTEILEAQNLGFEYETLNGDGFYIQTKDKSIFIDGDNDRGTLYGVYEYLEKYLGVKFISHDCTVTPKTDELNFKEINVKSVPDFKYRGALTRSVNRKDADQAYYARTRQTHEFIDVEEKYGGNSAIYKGVNVAHSSLSYVPTREYFVTPKQQEKNAAMYYLKDGKPYDICWTNGLTADGKVDESIKTSTIKVAIESLKKFIQDDPNAEFYPFAQEDHRDGFCPCTNCTSLKNKYNEAGVIIRFVNCMLEEVQKWVDTSEYAGKQVKIMTLAYMYTLNPPTKFNNSTGKYEVIDQTVKPSENMYIRLADIDSNIYYTLSETAQTVTAHQTILKRWSDITDKLMAWLYGYDHMNLLVYNPIIQKLQQELTDFKNANVCYPFIELDIAEFNDVSSMINAYVYTKLCWDISRDPYALRAEFIEHYFGIVSETIQGVYEYMDAYYKQNVINSNGNSMMSRARTNPSYHKLSNLNYIIDECDSAIQTIQSSNLRAEEKEQYQIRVERVKLSPLYLCVINGSTYYGTNTNLENQIRKEFHALATKLSLESMGAKINYNDWKQDYPYAL